MPRYLRPVGLLVLAVATVAACGGSSSSSNASNSSASAHNAADTAFASSMVRHHGECIQMADMILAKTSNADVKRIATDIKTAQSPEIDKMSSWLTSWNEPAPSPSMSMSMTMPGVMSAADMQRLGGATGVAADKLFLALMQEHFTRAVTMAQTELQDGRYPDAKVLARQIVRSQNQQIAAMKALAAALTRDR